VPNADQVEGTMPGTYRGSGTGTLRETIRRASGTATGLPAAFLSATLLIACGGATSPDAQIGPDSTDSAGAPATGAARPAGTVVTAAAAPALPPSEVANAAPDEPLGPRDAFRLVEQSTFGARLEDIDTAGRLGAGGWIDAQMTTPPTFMSDGLARSAQPERWNEYVNVWWRMAIEADDQLRQRVAFALSQIVVVSGANGLAEHPEGMSGWYDLLLRHAFGNYRDLLGEATLNPMMGEYLSMKGNRRADPEENIHPDENFARELLQLFSIGPVLLNPDGSPMVDGGGVPLPSYDQQTIEQFARAFTGWHFADADNFRWPSASTQDFVRPMQAWPEFHDAGAKTLLGGTVLPAGQSAEVDLEAALDNVFAHPNVGPFVVRQLIQRLVTSNPSPDYIRDVVAVFDRNVAGERGNLASTVKAILMHREARSGHLDAPDTFGKAKEPLIRVTQLWRAFGPVKIHPEFHYAWVNAELGQGPLQSPSVFNFYRPDFSQPGRIGERGLVSPEFGILDESSVALVTTRLLANSLWSHNHKADIDPKRISIAIDRELAIEPDPEALIDHLDLLLLGGRMPGPLRAEVRALMSARDYDGGAAQRVGEAIFLIATSPEAAVQI